MNSVHWKKVTGIVLLLLLVLAGCGGSGHTPTYIISDGSEDKTPSPEEEQAR